MSKNGGLMRTFAGVVLLGVTYKVAENGALGTVGQQLAVNLQSFFHSALGGGTRVAGTTSGTSSGSTTGTTGWTQVGVADAGGFPLEISGTQIRQVRTLGGTNSYSTNDVFQVLGGDGLPTGQWVAFVGSCHFVDAGDHSISVGVAGC